MVNWREGGMGGMATSLACKRGAGEDSGTRVSLCGDARRQTSKGAHLDATVIGFRDRDDP